LGQYEHDINAMPKLLA